MRQKIVMCMAIIAMFASCKKDLKQTPSMDIDNVKTSSAKLVTNRVMENYLTYEGNNEMTALNTNLYLYMNGMRAVFKSNPTILNSVYSKVSPAYQNGLFLKSFINNNSACLTGFNSAINTFSPSLNNGQNHANTLADGMNCNGIGYEPVLVYYNEKHSNLDEEYYLALLVEDMDEDTTSIEEYIPAWHIRADGTYVLELLDYYDAYYQNIPVFLFAYEPDKEYSFMSGTILPPTHNTSDVDTYPPNGHAPMPQYLDPIKKTLTITAPVSYPDPGYVVHEAAHLYAHHEQYNSSEYTSSQRASYIGGTSTWNLEVNLGTVPRYVVNCGCFYDMPDQTFVNDVNNSFYSLLTYERDYWAFFKHITINSVTFDFRASKATDIYVFRTNATTLADFPYLHADEIITNGPAIHLLRRF